MVKDYFFIDSLGVRSAKEPMSNDDQKAVKIMQETTKRKGEKFETGLLWKDKNVFLPDNYQMANTRMFFF